MSVLKIIVKHSAPRAIILIQSHTFQFELVGAMRSAIAKLSRSIRHMTRPYDVILFSLSIPHGL